MPGAGEVITDLSAEDVEALVADGTIAGGMIPKVETALAAVRQGCGAAVILDGRDPANIVLAPEDGLFEALLEPGDPVSAGQPVGRLWFIDRPDRPPIEIEAPLDGYVAVTKAIPVTEQGDCVFVLGQPIDRAELL